MKKFISKIGIIFLMALVIGIGYGVSAKAADDDSVIGISNLNNTVENSAKIGDSLKLPEKGWKRYDDRNSQIMYLGDWNKNNHDMCYNKTYSYLPTVSADNKKYLTFKFYGTDLRVIGGLYQAYSNDIKIAIDNVEESFNQNRASNEKSVYQAVVYEKKGLEKSIHEVKIYLDNSTKAGQGGYKTVELDAIDINENGSLKPYNQQEQSIILDKSSINILEGNSEKLTATVVPDNITNKKVIWSSSDKNIATVDENGNVTAVKEGQAIVTAKVDGIDLKAECKVTVTKEDATVEPSKPNTKGDAVLTITMTNGNIKKYNVSMKVVNKFVEWYEDRASGSNGNPYFKFDKTRNEDEPKTEYIVFDKISSFQVEQNK